MLDPITAIAACTTAFNMTKKLVGHGQELEAVMGQLGKWFGAASDLSRAEHQRKHPTAFQKLTSGKSMEEEAFAILVHKKKMAEQERELAFLLNMRFGFGTWDEMILLRRQIRKERELQVYNSMEAKKEMINNMAILGLSILIIGALGGGAYMISLAL